MADTTYNGSEKELLEEARENLEYAQERWKPDYDEGDVDMCHVAGDPWDEDERRIREHDKRPIRVFDELGQYVNQAINAIREQKRAIKLIPEGGGADDKTAEYRQGRIRAIEDRSNAAYARITAFENAIQRGMGFYGLTTRFRYDDAKDLEKNPELLTHVEACYRTFPNTKAVLIDPDYREADQSDIGFAYVLDLIRKRNYKEKFPQASTTDFSEGDIKAAAKWFKGDSVQTAEYWKLKRKMRTALIIGGQLRWLEEFKSAKLVNQRADDGKMAQFLRISGHPNIPVDRARKVEERNVCQFLLNGVELLDYTEWPGDMIPIIGVFGKEIWTDEGDGPKRKILSLVRLARDPYAAYCYYRTCELELVGQVPKVPYIGYEGQFDDDPNWETVNRVPVPYLQVKSQLDATGQAVLPLPRREVWEPPIQAMEMAAESARRAIQAAMGISNLPTAAQRQNEKSGRALERIESQQQRGSYHFVDNYDRGIKKDGRILNDILDEIEDTPRDVGIIKADDSYSVEKLTVDEDGPVNGRGEHGVTVVVGPTYANQQEEAEDFLNILARDPAQFGRVGDLVVKLKRLGPIGDQIAERLQPPEFAMKGPDGKQLAPAVAQMLKKEKMDKAALNNVIQQLEGEVKKLQDEQQAKALELESRERIEKAKITANSEVERYRIQLELEKIQSNEAIAMLKGEVDALKAGMALDADAAARAADRGAKEIESGNAK